MMMMRMMMKACALVEGKTLSVLKITAMLFSIITLAWMT